MNMQAAVVHEFGKPLEVETVSIADPGEGHVLISVETCGVCHTDLHAAKGDWPVKPSLPFIPGHEAVGTVASVGKGVVALKEGDRVGVPWLHSACGICEYCLTGRETLCPNQQNTGYSVNGGFAEYVLAPAAFATPIPTSLPSANASPVLCAGVTTYKGLKVTGVKPGQWVAISGVGGLGQAAIQYAKAMGMHVAAVDISPQKLKEAAALGAEITINAKETDPADEITRLIGGVHGALVTAVSPSAFKQAIGMLRRGGTVALVGLPPGGFETPIFDVVLKGLSIRGSIVGTRADLEEALAFAGNGQIESVIEMQPLTAINDIFERLEEGKVAGRVVLEFN